MSVSKRLSSYAECPLDDAGRKIVEDHFAIVPQVTRKYKGKIPTRDHEDLVSWCMYSLCTAVVRLRRDGERGDPRGYLTSSVYQSCKQFFRDVIRPRCGPPELMQRPLRETMEILEKSGDMTKDEYFSALAPDSLSSPANPYADISGANGMRESIEDTLPDALTPSVPSEVESSVMLESIYNVLKLEEQLLLCCLLRGDSPSEIEDVMGCKGVTMRKARKELEGKLRFLKLLWDADRLLPASSGSSTLRRYYSGLMKDGVGASE